VLAEVHGSPAETARQRDEVMEVLGRTATLTLSPDPAALWQWRDGVSEAVSSMIGGKVSEDVAVPVERLAEALERVAAIGDAHGLRSCAWGHAGDGNLHATFLVRRVSRGDLDAAERAAADVFAMAIELGGTITGEHGVGSVKRGWLAEQWSPAAVAIHEKIKLVLDPKGLLNPGKKVARVDGD
jgi:FAD/FMN-containing dehydrogenase